MATTMKELLGNVASGEGPPIIVLKGDDAYLQRELKQLYQAQGFEVRACDCKKNGPGIDIEEIALQGGGLFAQKLLVVVESVPATSKWSADAKKLWERIKPCFDGHTLTIIFQVPADKRSKWTLLKGAEITMATAAAEQAHWLKRMNEAHKAKLAKDKIQYLINLEADLLTLDHWVQLWSLGGDVWAKGAIAWGDPEHSGQSIGQSASNPAFAWVDAALSGDQKRSKELARYLLNNGQEPFMLLGLLAKSIRILGILDLGGNPQGQPPFLINKMRSLLQQKKRVNLSYARSWVKKLSFVDIKLKSSVMSKEAAFEWL